MSEFYGPFDAGSGASVTEDFWSVFAQAFARSGVIVDHRTELQVSAGSGLSVNVAGGGAWLVAQGYENTASKNLGVDSNSSGSTRIDRVVLRRDVVANTIVLAVVKGTPAGSPVPPSLTRNTSIYEISLAKVTVTNGAGSVTVTDERADVNVCGYTYPGVMPDYFIRRSSASITLTTVVQDIPNCIVQPLAPGRWNIRAVFDFSIEGAGDAGAVLIGGCDSDVGVAGWLEGSAALGSAVGNRGTVAQEWDLEVPAGSTGTIKLQAHKTSGTGASRCLLKNTSMKVTWSPD